MEPRPPWKIEEWILTKPAGKLSNSGSREKSRVNGTREETREREWGKESKSWLEFTFALVASPLSLASFHGSQ